MSSEPGAYAQFSVNTRSCRVVRYYPTADLAITRACNHGPQLLFSQSAAQLLQLALPMNSFSCDCSRLALAHRDASAIRDPFQGDSSTGQTDFRETKEFMLAFRQPIARIIDFAGMSGKILISYHYPCPDGIFAALTAHLELQQGSLTPVVWLPNTVYQPRQLEELSLEAGDTLYMLDFAGPHGFAQAAAQTGARVIVLDHHKTAFDMLMPSQSQFPSLDLQLDMNRSGATIALDYFRPQVSKDVQTLFQYIEDADLWRWKLPNSKQFHAGLGEMKLEYDVQKNPAIFDQLCKLKADDIIDKGRTALDKQDKAIAAAMTKAFTVKLGGRRGAEQLEMGCCLGVIADAYLSSIRSSLGSALAEASDQRGLRPMGVVAYFEEAVHDDTRLKVSLRSLRQEDTTVVSEMFGGGGHRNASSFMLDQAEFDSWVLET